MKPGRWALELTPDVAPRHSETGWRWTRAAVGGKCRGATGVRRVLLLKLVPFTHVARWC